MRTAVDVAHKHRHALHGASAGPSRDLAPIHVAGIACVQLGSLGRIAIGVGGWSWWRRWLGQVRNAAVDQIIQAGVPAVGAGDHDGGAGILPIRGKGGKGSRCHSGIDGRVTCTGEGNHGRDAAVAVHLDREQHLWRHKGERLSGDRGRIERDGIGGIRRDRTVQFPAIIVAPIDAVVSAVQDDVGLVIIKRDGVAGL